MKGGELFTYRGLGFRIVEANRKCPSAFIIAKMAVAVKKLICNAGNLTDCQAVDPARVGQAARACYLRYHANFRIKRLLESVPFRLNHIQ